MAETPSELQSEIEKLEARHAEHPEGRFFVPLANAYRKTGEIGRAETVLREGLRRHPEYLSAHIVLGRCLADRGAIGEAVAEFQHVLSIDPQNLSALRTLGDLAMASGRADESASWYEQLLAVDPLNEEARRALDSLAHPAPEPETDWRDAGPAAAAATTSEPPARAAVPAPPAATYSAEEGDHDADAIDGEVTGEVVTETIAELYARQGLVDRAIEVYRELIRRRGGDAALERRLAELMAPPAPPDPAAPEPQRPDGFQPAVVEREWSSLAPEEVPREEGVVVNEAFEPYDEPLPVLGEAKGLPVTIDERSRVDADPFASSFEYGFLDEDLTAATPEARVADAADGADAQPSVAAPETEPARSADRTIADYLGELAAWKPGSGAARDGEVASDRVDTAMVEPLGEPAAEPFAAPTLGAFETPAAGVHAAELEPVVDLVAELEAEVAEPDVEIAEPWVDAVAGVEPAASEPEPAEPWVSAASEAETASASSPAPAGVQDEDLAFPWELPDDTGSPAASAAPVPQPSEEDEPFPFENFFTDAATTDESPAQPGPAPAIPAPAPASQEEEDDLESFQAWLRSLKR